MNISSFEILSLLYLIGSVTFILGLKMLSHPDSARRGNTIAAVGMGIVILGTIFLYSENGTFLSNFCCSSSRNYRWHSRSQSGTDDSNA